MDRIKARNPGDESLREPQKLMEQGHIIVSDVALAVSR